MHSHERLLVYSLLEYTWLSAMTRVFILRHKILHLTTFQPAHRRQLASASVIVSIMQRHRFLFCCVSSSCHPQVEFLAVRREKNEVKIDDVIFELTPS